MRKPDFCLRENKDADHTAQLIRAFALATEISVSKSEISSLLLSSVALQPDLQRQYLQED